MSDERIKTIANQLISAIENQMTDIQSVDAKELGMAVDMLKDLSEYCYYSTVVETMNNNSESDNMDYINEYIPETQKYYKNIRPRYYRDYRYDPDYDRSMNSIRERMYYSTPTHSSKDGRAYLTRRNYMDIKDTADKTIKMQEMETYIQDLSTDISEMINNMDATDKATVKQKLTTLASKIV